VLVDPGALLLPEVAFAGASVRMEDDFMEILNKGVARLRKLGFDPTAKLVRGQPAEEIGNFARQIEADLIVVGHRRQSAFDRWWSGPMYGLRQKSGAPSRDAHSGSRSFSSLAHSQR
jgi:nucleotide-binding universal stress UspA family protein